MRQATILAILFAGLCTAGPAAAQTNMRDDNSKSKIDLANLQASTIVVIEHEQGFFELTDGSNVVGYKLKPISRAETGADAMVGFQTCKGLIINVPTNSLRKSQKTCGNEPKGPPSSLWSFTLSTKPRAAGVGSGKVAVWEEFDWTMTDAQAPSPKANPSYVDCDQLPPTFRAAFSSKTVLRPGTLLEKGTGSDVIVKTAATTTAPTQIIQREYPDNCTLPLKIKAFPIDNPAALGVKTDKKLFAITMED